MFFGGSVFSIVRQSGADWVKSIMIGSAFLLVGAAVRATGRVTAGTKQP